MTEAKEYIERGAAINSLTEDNLVLNLDSVMDGLSNQIKRSAHRILASLPAADVEPVRHGRWVELEDGDCKCSLCGCYHHAWEAHGYYCQHCGARMDGAEPPKEET